MRVRLLLTIGLLTATPLRAQQHVHTEGMQHDATTAALPTLPGQAAFGAIAEVIRLLSTDSTTDWSKVNIEALRQHLIDMDNVILRTTVYPTIVPGGVSLQITGDAVVLKSVQRMVMAHARELDRLPQYHAQARELNASVVLVVTSENASDRATESRIRALGLAGLLAEGDHHAAHHLMLARGEQPHAGH